jgi:soluble lytic murein transglycosylase-like protein
VEHVTLWTHQQRWATAARSAARRVAEAIYGCTPAINIHIGCAEIASRLEKTGLNPMLVAAAYNSGDVYHASKSTKYRNRWHLRSHGNHVDRAAKWYGEACSVLAQLRD